MSVVRDHIHCKLVVVHISNLHTVQIMDAKERWHSGVVHVSVNCQSHVSTKYVGIMIGVSSDADFEKRSHRLCPQLAV